MMKKIDADKLLEKYKSGTITDEELAMLESWYLQEIKSNKSYEGLEKHMQILDKNVSSILSHDVQLKNNWKKIAAAASLFIALGAGFWFYNGKSPATDTKKIVFASNDIGPGKKSATLTLSNGKKIRLIDAADGKLAEETGVKITKTTNGQIIYEATDGIGEGVLNTVSTTNGESYSVHLPDGSLVILNAASSLTFATNLNKLDVRSVTLDGEAYFEISKDKKHPFVVETATQEVQVLGTHFNINSYKNEVNTKTTLIEGSVRVTPKQSNQRSIIIKPESRLCWPSPAHYR